MPNHSDCSDTENDLSAAQNCLISSMVNHEEPTRNKTTEDYLKAFQSLSSEGQASFISSAVEALKDQHGEGKPSFSITALPTVPGGITSEFIPSTTAMPAQRVLSNIGPDAEAKRVEAEAEPSKLRVFVVKFMMWFIAVNVTAITTTVLVLGVRTGRLPDMTPVTALINLAFDILKTILT